MQISPISVGRQISVRKNDQAKQHLWWSGFIDDVDGNRVCVRGVSTFGPLNNKLITIVIILLSLLWEFLYLPV